MNLKSLSKNNLKLCNYTTIRIGGPAKEFFVPESMPELVSLAGRYGFDFYLLGGGSNLLVVDKGVSKPVIKLGKGFDSIVSNGTNIEVGAATPFARLIKRCEKESLGGLENLAGIPASLGGIKKPFQSLFYYLLNGDLPTGVLILYLKTEIIRPQILDL